MQCEHGAVLDAVVKHLTQRLTLPMSVMITIGLLGWCTPCIGCFTLSSNLLHLISVIIIITITIRLLLFVRLQRDRSTPLLRGLIVQYIAWAKVDANQCCR